jgi:deoxyuridine 5'-triphosphate nucleotidohydrolase
VIAVKVQGDGALPVYSSPAAAGADLVAAEAVTLPPGGWASVGTALRLEIPPGHVGLVWPRSGLAVRHGIDTLAGVIDSDYRGEVRVVLATTARSPIRWRAATAWPSSSSSAWSGWTSCPPRWRPATAAPAASGPRAGSDPSPPPVIACSAQQRHFRWPACPA